MRSIMSNVQVLPLRGSSCFRRVPHRGGNAGLMLVLTAVLRGVECMRRLRRPLLALTGLSLGFCTFVASAGSVAEQFGAGAFGLPWSASKGTIEAKYPGGKWDKDESGIDRYCAPSAQVLLGLPPPHQTKE